MQHATDPVYGGYGGYVGPFHSSAASAHVLFSDVSSSLADSVDIDAPTRPEVNVKFTWDLAKTKVVRYVDVFATEGAAGVTVDESAFVVVRKCFSTAVTPTNYVKTFGIIFLLQCTVQNRRRRVTCSTRFAATFVRRMRVTPASMLC